MNLIILDYYKIIWDTGISQQLPIVVWQFNVLTIVLKFSRPVSIKKKAILSLKKTWMLLRVSWVGCVDSHAQI